MSGEFKDAVKELVDSLLDVSAHDLPTWIRNSFRDYVVQNASERLGERIQEEMGLEAGEALKLVKQRSEKLIQALGDLAPGEKKNSEGGHTALALLLLLAMPSILKEHSKPETQTSQ